ncbi:glycosyltransferase [uncultured Pseudokineococcus sp.]|uniref:glycosyltransferase n=1 Tax=uncultured Pseudokineococcus sp. TaxID=1642928 RepID=UPI00260F580E|nr:glycosyltransferase [uncultured Pseudokineococcus sp.]
MRSVVVAKYVPWPPNSGDKRRTLGVVRALAERGPVVVCAFAGDDEDAAGLAGEGVEVRAVPRRRSVRGLVAGLLRSRSLTSARFWDPALHRLVVEEAASADVLVVEHVQLLPYARGTRAGTTALDMHNVESSLTGRYARSQRGLRRAVLAAEARRLRALEARSTEADLLAVVSEGDAALLRDVVTHPRVVVVPNAWDEPTPLPSAPDPVVSFVALLSWAPNVDAATWFTTAVWPLVRERVPGARLQLVGRNPAPAVQRLAGDDVEVTGTVPDLAPWYARTRVAVAPLRSGGGSRLKILEALAHARPVVATAVGAEGLEDLVGRGVVVADDPAAMAAEVVALLQDPRRAAEEGERGAAAVAADHSWTAATKPLVDALPTAGAPR